MVETAPTIRVSLWICALCCLAGSLQAQTPAPADRQLTVLFTTDLYGRFSPIDCQTPPAVNFANLVGAIDRVREELANAGRPAPLILNGGDNIGPREFARYVLSKGPEGGAKLVGWMVRAGYELVAIGNQDFYAVPIRLDNYLRAGKSAGIPFAAANLDCADKSAGLCAYIGAGPDRYRLLERAGLRIAVLSVIHEDLASDVPAANLKGIQVVNPYRRAREVVDRARQAGADLVVIIAHLDRSETSPRNTLRLARTVPDADLIIANAFVADDQERGIEIIRFADGASPIVGCDLFGEHLCRTDLRLTRQDGRWKIGHLENHEIDTAQAPPDHALRQELMEEHQAYCADWDRPVGAARLVRPLSADEFRTYLMQIMRTTTGSELACVNRGLVNERAGFPLAGSLSRHDFFVSLPHRNRLYTFVLDELAITLLCKQLAEEKLRTGANELQVLGLDCGPDNKNTVNGRPVETGTRYQAVTIEYLAKGMLGYFKEQAKRMRLVRPSEAEEAPILGEVARTFLSSPPFVGAQPAPIDLGANFPDLARQLRWVFDGGLTLNLADTHIANASQYEESQLTRKQFTALKTELRGAIGASSSLHAFAFAGQLKYARANTEEQGWIESEDLLTFGLLYKLNLLRSVRSGWWVPTPYLEAKLETELTRPADDPLTAGQDEGRAFHHLELTTTLGARFPLFDTLEAKIGFGLRSELLDPQAEPTYGLDIGYKLVRTDLFTLLGSPFQMESELSAFFADIGRDNTLKGTWTNRLFFALVGPIYFQITHDLFVYRFSTRGYGLASDLTFGLSYNARATVQTF